MKNFPHQFSDLEKLTGALLVANVLIGDEQNLADDGIFGEALLDAGIYQFRNPTGNARARLALEKRKPVGSQGFRTAARDIKRFFEISGLLLKRGTHFTVTKRGRDLIEAADNLELRNALWREAMLDMKLGDQPNNTSHPYRILSKLVADNPGMATNELILALEARNDTPEEYVRISRFIGQGFDRIVSTLGVGVSHAKNALKILPAIAEQVGDISRERGRVFPHSPVTTSTEDSLHEPIAAGEETTAPVVPVPVEPDDIAALPSFRGEAGGLVDLSAAIEIRKRRTIAHHKTVISIARFLADHGYSLHEDPYDCLAYKTRVGGLLVEVKTLDGSRPDERRQAEKALGQLKGYKFYNVPDDFKRPHFAELAVFSEVPDATTVRFMKENHISSAWRRDAQWLTADRSGNTVNLSPDDLVSRS